jgi:hypothetical protein
MSGAGVLERGRVPPRGTDRPERFGIVPRVVWGTIEAGATVAVWPGFPRVTWICAVGPAKTWIEAAGIKEAANAAACRHARSFAGVLESIVIRYKY